MLTGVNMEALVGTGRKETNLTIKYLDKNYLYGSLQDHKLEPSPPRAIATNSLLIWPYHLIKCCAISKHYTNVTGTTLKCLQL